MVGSDRGWKFGLLLKGQKASLAVKAAHRDVVKPIAGYALRESAEAYGLNFAGENEALRHQNTFLWDESVAEART